MWLLYFSPIVLKPFQDEEVFLNWTFLVDAMYIFLAKDVTEVQIQKGTLLLELFIKGAEKLYGPSVMHFCVTTLGKTSIIKSNFAHCLEAWKEKGLFCGGI